MKTQFVIKKAGDVKALAELLGITTEAIYQWGDEPPKPRQWQLQVLKPEWFAQEKRSTSHSPRTPREPIRKAA